MSAIKEIVEIETLKQMSYKDINALMNKINDENKKLKDGYGPILDMLDEVIDKHFDFEVPEFTSTPEPLATLQNIRHHIYGLFLEVDGNSNADTEEVTTTEGD
ncbi:MAG: hypothetical protein AB7H97_06370 [Pseudobdellovibrionaceae bacterium]